MANHRKQVVETRLAKFYSTINQAIKTAEADYGDANQWDRLEYGFNEDEDGNPTTSKALAWFEKYLKPYLKYTKYEVDNNSEGQVATYFPDGSLMLISANSIIFYPSAKDYELLLVPADSFGTPGYVRISYCVQTKQIEDALPAFKKLAESYQK